MEKLLTLAEQEHIKVEYFDFIDPVKGIYFSDEDMPPIIGLDTSLKYNIPLLRSVMAEELGHHFTSVGDCLPREFYNYSRRTIIDKIEYKALSWAANYLIPFTVLKEVITYERILTKSELAHYFRVVPEIIDIRMQILKNKEKTYINNILDCRFSL